MKFKVYSIIFILFIILLFLSLQKEISLEYEWKYIMKDFFEHKGYRLFNLPTAYMPPFYSYYLLICSKLFGFTDWIKVSCVIQALIFYFSFYYLFTTFLGNHRYRLISIFAFCSLIFFPPVFVGNIGVGSFSLSVSLLSVFFSLLYRIYNEDFQNRKNLIFISIISVAGLYLRYEFLFIIILSGVIFLVLKRISVIYFLKILLFIFVAYLPWTIRNYIEIGKFTYSTSMSYNFAKGNNLNYNVFSSYNFPHTPDTKRMLSIDVLYKEFKSEKDIDNYLSELNQNFVRQNPALFLKLSVKKFFINITQYFPDYNSLTKYHLYNIYSLFFIIFQLVLIFCIIKLKRTDRNYLFTFALSFYLFFLFFYAVAPMPRYFLFFYPVFTMIIIKTILEEYIPNFKK